MNAAGKIVPASRGLSAPDPFADPGETVRWTKALAIVLGVHALPLLLTAWWPGLETSAITAEPAIFIDMSPPAAPPIPPSEQPSGPQQQKADAPQPRAERKTVETPPVSNPTVAIPVRPPEPEKVEAQEVARETTAPPSRPLPPAERFSSGQPAWEGMVLAALDKRKRFPREALSRRQQGVPYIRFVMDRNGKVLTSQLERSSGYRSLDDEAVGLPRRAQPFPKPPDQVRPGEPSVELVVPVEFFLRL